MSIDILDDMCNDSEWFPARLRQKSLVPVPFTHLQLDTDKCVSGSRESHSGGGCATRASLTQARASQPMQAKIGLAWGPGLRSTFYLIPKLSATGRKAGGSSRYRKDKNQSEVPGSRTKSQAGAPLSQQAKIGLAGSPGLCHKIQEKTHDEAGDQ